MYQIPKSALSNYIGMREVHGGNHLITTETRFVISYDNLISVDILCWCVYVVDMYIYVKNDNMDNS